MRVLVVTASKHGSTRQIGEVIGAQLRSHGHDAITREAEAVADADLLEAEAVVLGSATYGARLLSSAHAVQTRLRDQFQGPVWQFAVGLKNLTRDPLAPATTRPGTAGARPARFPVFGGVIHSASLSLAERTLIGALGANDRDLRDLELVQAWAEAVAAQLERPRAQGTSSTLPVV